jgi:hypothetical protein
MSENQLDEKILSAIREGKDSRGALMQIASIRINTWAVVAERLRVLTKRGTLIASKAGWRLVK